ncbi:MAG: hypothetical protein COA52_02745 [Hyphomicrobiales bacterium]|nr:MAG: hypothetical protein COA52_02745 [Hyphomicrobiales bacterium]
MVEFDHINIHADNPELVAEFLINVLGVKLGPIPDGFAVTWLYAGDQAIIHIRHRTAEDIAASQGIDRGRGWIDHVAFGPFDFDDTVAKLDALKLSYKTSGIASLGLRQIFVEGPEGIKLELKCPNAV